MSSRVIVSYGKKILVIAICIALLILVKNISSSIFSTHERSQILKELQGELSNKKEQEVLLTQKLSIAKTDAFVENEARSKLGLVREGEKILVDEKIKPVSSPVVEVEPANWQKWLSLFTK